MKICFHSFWDITHDFIGGTERFLIELSKELQVLGYSPFIVCSGGDIETMIQGVPVYGILPPQYLKSFARYGEAKPKFLRENFVKENSYEQGLKKLADYVQFQVSGFDFDILHLNSFASAIFLNEEKPTVVTNHENEIESNNLWGDGFFKELAALSKKTGSRLSDHYALAVPSIYYANKYTKLFGTYVHGINLGINLSTFPKSPPFFNVDKQEALQLLLPSRLEPKQKGHDIALKACKKLISQGINVKMTFTGVRKDNENIVAVMRDEASRLGILEHLVIKSFAEIQKAYDEAEIIISPERYCSYGLSISESLALGKHTILSDIPTYMEIAEGYNHAHFFEQESSDSLADTIKKVSKLMLNDSTLEAIKFREKYDLRECAKKYSNLYLNSKIPS